MLLRRSLLLALPLITFCGFATAASDNECDIKAKEIQQQIDYAKQHGNTRRAAGLETALKEVKTHCTEEVCKPNGRKKSDKTAQRDRAPTRAKRSSAKR